MIFGCIFIANTSSAAILLNLNHCQLAIAGTQTKKTYPAADHGCGWFSRMVLMVPSLKYGSTRKNLKHGVVKRCVDSRKDTHLLGFSFKCSSCCLSSFL